MGIPWSTLAHAALALVVCGFVALANGGLPAGKIGAEAARRFVSRHSGACHAAGNAEPEKPAGTVGPGSAA